MYINNEGVAKVYHEEDHKLKVNPPVNEFDVLKSTTIDATFRDVKDVTKQYNVQLDIDGKSVNSRYQSIVHQKQSYQPLFRHIAYSNAWTPRTMKTYHY